MNKNLKEREKISDKSLRKKGVLSKMPEAGKGKTATIR